MPTLVEALAPAFAAGFAIQQFMEIFDFGVTWVSSKLKLQKKTLAMILSAVVGAGVSYSGDIDVLYSLHEAQATSANTSTAQQGAGATAASATKPDQANGEQPLKEGSPLGIAISALVIGAGTEGFNSILKLLGYKKEETKGAAETEKREAGLAGVPNANAADLVLPAPAVI